ncbi:ADP-ribosylation [Hypoxylon fuscum]|nr:ADP-ribosylation [Hypoxylon fuscum]
MPSDPELSEDDLPQLSLLRDFETDKLIEAELLSRDEVLTSPIDNEITFEHAELSLHVTTGSYYPAVPVIWEVNNHTLPRQVVDELRAQLRRIVEDAATTNNLSRWREREDECEYGIFKPIMVVLELATQTRAHLRSWRQGTASKIQIKPPPKTYLPFKEKPASSMTTSDIAYQYLRKTPQKICSQIPPKYRILHVEEILRTDLAHKFREKQEKMKSELLEKSYAALRSCVPAQLRHSKRKEVFVEYMLKPRVTFHGTSRQNIPSIVHYGFIKPGERKPGTGEEHEVRCGATYGRGIYSSPDPNFALSYTDYLCHATKPNEFFGIKLLVCATLMGRSAYMTRDDNWRTQSKPYPGADSHVANRDLEYIVFDTAQILPVYVIHIDWGQDNIQYFIDLPCDPENFVPTQTKSHPKLFKHDFFPGDVQRHKAATLARAAKYFPYGFGAATGSRFVVEEIGEVDEDDEEYGDYQALRGEEIKDGTNLDFWSWVKVGEEEDAAARGEDPEKDEYSKQRAWYNSEESGTVPAWDRIPDPRAKDNGDGNEEEEDGDLGLGFLMV